MVDVLGQRGLGFRVPAINQDDALPTYRRWPTLLAGCQKRMSSMENVFKTTALHRGYCYRDPFNHSLPTTSETMQRLQQ